MATLRLALHRWTLVGIVAWSLVVLWNPRLCATDPTCGEMGWIPTAAWIGGILLILVLGYGLRPAREPGTTWKDKVVGLAIALGILVLAGVAFTLYQDYRSIA